VHGGSDFRGHSNLAIVFSTIVFSTLFLLTQKYCTQQTQVTGMPTLMSVSQRLVGFRLVYKAKYSMGSIFKLQRPDAGVGFQISVLKRVVSQGKVKIQAVTPEKTQSSSCTRMRWRKGK